MARRIKELSVQKFGGVDDHGSLREEGIQQFESGMTGEKSLHANVNYDVKSIETESQTKLEHDEGYGNAVIIRAFEFGVNPEAFKQHKPTKQELFNSHYRGIEVALWKDGMKVMPDVNPRITLAPEGNKYTIFVGAMPAKGHLLREEPKTLSQIVHGR